MDDRTASQAPLRARLIRWVPAVGWMAVIFTLSAQSDVRVTEDAGLDFVLRKTAHVTVFAILAMLLTSSAKQRRKGSGSLHLAARSRFLRRPARPQRHSTEERGHSRRSRAAHKRPPLLGTPDATSRTPDGPSRIPPAAP